MTIKQNRALGRLSDELLSIVLIGLRDIESRVPHFIATNELIGICIHLRMNLVKYQVSASNITEIIFAIRELTKQWPNYSGDMTYPVPVGRMLRFRLWFTNNSGSAHRYGYYHLPLWTGDYGNLRIKYLMWLIGKMELEQHVRQSNKQLFNLR